MSVKPVPQGYSTVTPWIISRDTVQLIDYMKRAFGAEELACLAGKDGAIEHAEVRIGDSVVMMFDARPEWPPTPGFLRLYVEDADAVHRQVVRPAVPRSPRSPTCSSEIGSGGSAIRWATCTGSRPMWRT
ncbi:hypothetical protein [Streptomyces capoamus]|uniref:hypothetical protein n=1 Tax=Streptomyces capoamus TaxID=68183 RepID=UPI001E402DDF|nr:hypothetical protein [Streptomyces capoamus]